MSRITSFGALLLAGTLAGRAPAAAQDLAGRWRAVPADSAALAEVYRETLRRGGDAVLRAVLATAADPARPPLVRVHAVAALHAWVHPASADLLGSFLWAARDAQVVCEDSRSWRPGQTLRACTRTGTVLEHHGPPAAAPRATLTPAPALGDSLRAVLVAILRGDPSLAVRGAADLLLYDLDPSLKDARSPRSCGAGRALVPRRGGGPAGAAPEGRRVHTLAEVAEPPSIADACPAVRELARSYPPILWDQGRTVTVVLSLVAGRDGAAREVSVARSSGYARVDAIARSVAERLRFAPARAAGAPVDVRVEVPVEFSVASRYPRVAVQ